jgi:crossover junction endodeoxyribonuclease RuvC
MRILGIDPGYAIVGWGIVDYQSNRFAVVDYGSITTNAHTSFPSRLATIYTDLVEIINHYKPDTLSIEKLFFNDNAKTAIDVSQARGVILLAAQQYGLSISEYTPLQVKSAIVGYGRAEKAQVQEMTRIMLKLKSIPKPDDAADALGLAICHGTSSGSLLKE